MKRFIKKIVLFPVGLIMLYVMIYLSYNAYLNHSFSSKNAVFVWGDSQTYYGIDISELSNSLERKVFTSAHSGAGVYDFLVFTQQVPNDSEVIVSISKLGQIRRKENDFNRSGLSFWALKELYTEGYSISEIVSIFKLNLKPKRNIFETTKLFSYSDSMEIGLPLSHFKNYYEDIPSFLNEKQNLYLEGINNLIQKRCNISFVEFPYHYNLKKIEDESQIKNITEEFKYQIKNMFNDFAVDTIEIDKSGNIFKDLSHLNSNGAKDLSNKLGKNILKQEYTTIYIAK